MERLPKENSEESLVCTDLFPVCSDFEADFWLASRRPEGLVRLQDVPIHALFRVRQAVKLLTVHTGEVSVQTGSVRTGILHGPLHPGFVVAPCGRGEAYHERGFFLARPVGALGADLDLVAPWMQSHEIVAQASAPRVSYDSNLWRETWLQLSHPATRR